jgi:hypothetical protein
LLYDISYSQIIQKREHKQRTEFLFFPLGFRFVGKDVVTYQKYYLYTVTAEASIGFYPFKKINFGAGFKYDYTFVWTNFSNMKPYSGYGFFFGYYLPYYINASLLKKITFFAECSYNYTDYTIVNDVFFNIEKGHDNMIILPVGIKFEFVKNFNLDFSMQYMKLGSSETIAPHGGLSYCINFGK